MLSFDIESAEKKLKRIFLSDASDAESESEKKCVDGIASYNQLSLIHFVPLDPESRQKNFLFCGKQQL